MTNIMSSQAVVAPRDQGLVIATPATVRASLSVIVVAAGIAGFLLTGTDSAASAVSNAGADLTRLLRLMAALKVVLALGAAVAVMWRFGAPVSPRWFAGYAFAGVAMAVGPGLIFGMAHVGLGALLLHGGLAATLVLLWRDPATADRLTGALAVRRAPLWRP